MFVFCVVLGADVGDYGPFRSGQNELAELP